PSMAPRAGPALDPREPMGQAVGEIARTHMTPQLPISRHLQEPIALLRSGATLLFDGKRTATCGDLMYLYTLAAPRLTKRLMAIAANVGTDGTKALAIARRRLRAHGQELQFGGDNPVGRAGELLSREPRAIDRVTYKFKDCKFSEEGNLQTTKGFNHGGAHRGPAYERLKSGGDSIEEDQSAVAEQVTEDAEDVVLELEEDMLPLPETDVVVVPTPAPAVEEDPESPNLRAPSLPCGVVAEATNVDLACSLPASVLSGEVGTRGEDEGAGSETVGIPEDQDGEAPEAHRELERPSPASPIETQPI
ncbi:unnamed protein product, partial [Closterium sp. Yama58-4]